MTVQVPVIDVGAPGAPAAIDAACRASGFFAVMGHGVDDGVIERLFAETYRFFDQPLDVKESVPRPGAGLQRGYTRVGAEVQARSHGDETPRDLSEHFAASRFEDTNVWPADAGFVAAWRDAFVALDAVARQVIRLCAVALDLDPAFFDDMVDRSPGTMRANHYPALESEPTDGAARGGAHTDYGSITLLRTDGVPGLEILDADGSWRPVPPVPGGFVVNVGDLLARWTNDRWRSTWHRVVLPPDGPPWPRRLSIAFFQTPNADTVVSCLPTCCSAEHPARYEPVVSGEWFDARIRSIYVET